MSLLLLSGGIESTTLAYALRPSICLTVDYGQGVAGSEISASKNICKALRLSHTTIEINLRRFGAGIMARRPQSALARVPEWWPFRNQMLISLAAALGLKNKQTEIVIGTVRSDRINKDGGLRFIRSMDRLLRHQEGSVRLNAPASRLSSEELLDRIRPPLDLLGLTFSCHRSNFSCGQCRGCWKNESCVSYALLKYAKRSKDG